MLKIIISPAKKMNRIDEYPCRLTVPAFQEKAQTLYNALKSLSFEELKKLWGCSERLAVQNYERLHACPPGRNLTPAILAYEGIQYQYMAPRIFSDTQWKYAERHLRILSGFYGILRPTDGVIPYRLEMQAKIASFPEIFGSAGSLYDYWKDSLYQNLIQDLHSSHDPVQIVNLASAEYSRIILPFVKPPVTLVSCIFGEWADGKIKVKGTLAKMARGEMIRWMSEQQIEDVREIQKFHGLNYTFDQGMSSDTEYVFVANAAGNGLPDQ